MAREALSETPERESEISASFKERTGLPFPRNSTDPFLSGLSNWQSIVPGSVIDNIATAMKKVAE